MRPDRLCDEACELGAEAIRIAFKAASMALDDPKRWKLTRRMFEINLRLKEISIEVNHNEDIPNEDRIVS